MGTLVTSNDHCDSSLYCKLSALTVWFYLFSFQTISIHFSLVTNKDSFTKLLNLCDSSKHLLSIGNRCKIHSNIEVRIRIETYSKFQTLTNVACNDLLHPC